MIFAISTHHVKRIGSSMRRMCSDTGQMVEPGLQWHPSLYAGSARYYAIGRVNYPAVLAEALATALQLDGSGRLLDVGCGPGNFTLLMAPWFEQAIGVDADQDMLAEAERRANESRIANLQWRQLRAEELPADLGRYQVISFAQSFHWMDQATVAHIALSMLEPGGACVHVHATTHRGVESDAALPHPQPPRSAIEELTEGYLGSVGRWGKGLPPNTGEREAEVWRAAGCYGPQRIEVPGQIVERTTDQIVAGIFSLSSSTPHLFGERRDAFEADLRRLLQGVNPSGIFSEQMREIAVDIWRPRND